MNAIPCHEGRTLPRPLSNAMAFDILEHRYEPKQGPPPSVSALSDRKIAWGSQRGFRLENTRTPGWALALWQTIPWSIAAPKWPVASSGIAASAAWLRGQPARTLGRTSPSAASEQAFPRRAVQADCRNDRPSSAAKICTSVKEYLDIRIYPVRKCGQLIKGLATLQSGRNINREEI